jgi:hypothetical protein
VAEVGSPSFSPRDGLRGDDQAGREERKVDEEHREDTAAVQVSEHVNDFGGV